LIKGLYNISYTKESTHDKPKEEETERDNEAEKLVKEDQSIELI